MCQVGSKAGGGKQGVIRQRGREASKDRQGGREAGRQGDGQVGRWLGYSEVVGQDDRQDDKEVGR